MSDNSKRAFEPSGKTIAIAATTIAPLGIQALASGSLQSAGQYRIVNAGTSTVFLGVGSTASIAQANAIAPVAGTPSSAIAMVPGAVEILSFGDAAFFSGLAAAAATVYITPGVGI